MTDKGQQHSRPDRAGLGCQIRDLESPTTDPNPGLGEKVKGIGIFTKQTCTATERCGNSGAQLGFKGRQHGPSYASAQESGVAIVRILPRLDSEVVLPCGGTNQIAWKIKQRASVPPGDPRHAGQASRSTAPGQTEQDSLGLIIGGVTKVDSAGTKAVGGTIECGIARRPCRCFRSTLSAHLNRDHFGGVDMGGECGHQILRPLARAGLESVIDRYDGHPKREAWSLKRQCAGQGEGIGTTRAGSENNITWLDLLEIHANRGTHGGK